ncbi:GDPD-domain-containing protein [Rozella allomycis CSF55]|uniref:GDPD-domain-containing protein n=1 Tax=Rozella allomycis (strain CSF55) TaxID=988480 RepID=A0A075B3I0_ROZAC|nr:PLC-like phosphodiesterase, TIM beta/alpha-barrel domain-containing protein [Rozella allomycis CSF55]RKP19505.1 GDPD-domain-containing protein [Rozella allomycis CSF55]|eukprot:EPZ35398.1 PLC-like phosphodiesterase, TIM beta/alpha-barrel domain-containing protein [Rozella allomycis CSF55]
MQIVGLLCFLLAIAMQGHRKCIELLLSKNAKVNEVDKSGWSAFEHALYHGHKNLSDLLSHKSELKEIPSNNLTVKKISEEKEKNLNWLKNEILIRISFGWHLIRTSKTHFTWKEKMFMGLPPKEVAIAISSDDDIKIDQQDILLVEGSYESIHLRIPVPANVDNWWSMIPSMADSFLKFNFFSNGKKIGYSLVSLAALVANPVSFRNMGMCDNINEMTDLIPKFNSLSATFPTSHTIINNESLPIGLLHLESLIVIGHRGAGANNGLKHPSVGENTILSFVTAASLGAEYVEFGTDLIPVIYHDWVISETGVDLTLPNASLKQFKEIKKKIIEREKRESRLRRSASFAANARNDNNDDEEPVQALKKPTRFVIGDGFTTLKETFQKSPPTIGFNIEVKYPTLDECEQYNLQPEEINVYVDKVLECVFDNAQDRQLFFSSFHPDICYALSLKQPIYPVFLLTEAGTGKVIDPRCNSIFAAVEFAQKHNLLGIVSESSPLLEAPHLINAVKENGLLLFTYGKMNNDVVSVRIQKMHGVDAVIVDSLARIRKSLTSDL